METTWYVSYQGMELQFGFILTIFPSPVYGFVQPEGWEILDGLPLLSKFTGCGVTVFSIVVAVYCKK